MEMWIGMALVILWTYTLELVIAQQCYRVGKTPLVDAKTKTFIRWGLKFEAKCLAAIVSLAILVVACMFSFVGARWWTPLWLITSFWFGMKSVAITGNPLIGETLRDRWFNGDSMLRKSIDEKNDKGGD